MANRALPFASYRRELKDIRTVNARSWGGAGAVPQRDPGEPLAHITDPDGPDIERIDQREPRLAVARAKSADAP